MTISQFITFLESIRKEKGEVEVLGYTKLGWYISAMGAGEITRALCTKGAGYCSHDECKPSPYHKFVVALQTDSSLERD